MEDTLIDLYLSGYANQETDAEYDVSMPVETDHGYCIGLSVDQLSEYLFPISGEIFSLLRGFKSVCAFKNAGNNNNKLQEGEQIPDEGCGENGSSGIVSDEGLCTDVTL